MIQSSDNILKEITRDLKDSKDDAYKGIELNINQIKKLSPIQESIIEFKDNEEFTLINKMFSKFSALGEGYIDFKKGLDPSIKNRKSLLKNVIIKILYFFILELIFINLIQDFLKIKMQKKALNCYG